MEEKISLIVNNISSNIKINDITVHSYGDNKNYVTLSLSSTDKEIDFGSVQNTIKNQLKTEFDCNSTVEWEAFS